MESVFSAGAPDRFARGERRLGTAVRLRLRGRGGGGGQGLQRPRTGKGTGIGDLIKGEERGEGGEGRDRGHLEANQ